MFKKFLLSAVSLISLAAILLPALNSARERGRSASCISNLKTIGTWSMMYNDDFEGYMMVANTGVSGKERTFQSVLYKLYGGEPYINNMTLDKIRNSIWMCPSATKCWGDINSGGSEYMGSFVLNRSVTGTPTAPKKINMFTEPTGCAIMLDGYLDGPNSDPVATTYNFFAHYSVNQYGSVGYPHANMTNVVFVDGHAAATGHDTSGSMYPFISRIDGNNWYK